MARVCDVIQVICALGLCHDEFMDTIKTGNLKGWFKGPTGKVERVPKLELLHDSKSCWDSSCVMANHAWGLCLVHQRIHEDLTKNYKAISEIKLP